LLQVSVKKACLEGSRWENFLGVTTSRVPLEIHPYFCEDTHCNACELMPPLASPSGLQHWFRAFLAPGYYENTLKKYPALYMNDGHNLFLKKDASREVLGNHRGESQQSRMELGLRLSD
jgi:hypothetical protein